MTPERVRPAHQVDERATLEGWLDYHRAVLAWKCEGLTDEQLRRRSVPPSTLSMVGLVRHLAKVEQNWFRDFAAEDYTPLYASETQPGLDFEGVDAADVGTDLANWQAEVARAREIVAAAPSLDATSGNDDFSLRWILSHMIEEYARHNGHADLLRQAIDGTTGEF